MRLAGRSRRPTARRADAAITALEPIAIADPYRRLVVGVFVPALVLLVLLVLLGGVPAGAAVEDREAHPGDVALAVEGDERERVAAERDVLGAHPVQTAGQRRRV